MASNEEHYTLPRPSFDKPVKILIVVAPYYKQIAEQLVKGATEEIEAAGGFHEVIEVPGALEVPSAIGIAERLSNFDGYVALGCVIRGATDHYEYVCAQAARGILDAGLESGVPMGFGLLTCETLEQALDRAGGKVGNKGADATLAALEMLGVSDALSD